MAHDDVRGMDILHGRSFWSDSIAFLLKDPLKGKHLSPLFHLKEGWGGYF